MDKAETPRGRKSNKVKHSIAQLVRQPVPAALRVVAGLDVSDMPEHRPELGPVRGQGRNEHGLTAKQEAFAQEASKGCTLAEAYRTAYAAENMKPSTIHKQAIETMNHPMVAARVKRLVEERNRNSSHDAARIRQTVIDGLLAEAINPRNPPASRIRAMELLGKLDTVGAFRDRVITEDAATDTSQLQQQLEDKLAALLKVG
jgi:hypothetical protein